MTPEEYAALPADVRAAVDHISKPIQDLLIAARRIEAEDAAREKEAAARAAAQATEATEAPYGGSEGQRAPSI